MEQPRQTEFTADEFIAWALEQPTGRFELDNGTVVAMAPERVNHSRAKLNVMIALRDAVGARGLTCEAMPDGASVRVNDRTVYGPDAVVRCGPPLPGDAVEMGTRHAVAVVSHPEPGIAQAKSCKLCLAAERGRYLIVDTDKRVVIDHHRGEEGLIGAESPEGRLRSIRRAWTSTPARFRCGQNPDPGNGKAPARGAQPLA